MPQLAGSGLCAGTLVPCTPWACEGCYTHSSLASFAQPVTFAHTLGGWGGNTTHELLARILKAGEQHSIGTP